MKIKYSDLLSKIPNGLFESVSLEYKVDRPNNKLTGKSLFNILLYNICEEDEISLRIVEASFRKHQFMLYKDGKKLKASKSGLSDRLKAVDYRYYETIFKKLSTVYSKEIKAEGGPQLKIFDSTLVTLSSNLLKCGFKTSKGNNQQVKFSIGFDGLPTHVRFGDTKSDMSEEFALKAAIKEVSFSKDDIVVFDRGISARKTFVEFKQIGINFVTRLNDNANYKIICSHNVTQKVIGDLEVLEDCIVHLKSKKFHRIEEDFRLIKTRNLKTGKDLMFITNMVGMTAEEVTEIYRTRWSIEIFFKFIKQYLNMKHFLSRDINGIKVVFYMILIAALLILTFKKLNNIPSFKFAKWEFVEQLRRAITYDIIILYRDDPREFKDSFIF